MPKYRLSIYPKDISTVLGISDRHARRLLRQIKDAYGKGHHQYVSFREFAEYTDLSLDEIIKRLV